MKKIAKIGICFLLIGQLLLSLAGCSDRTVSRPYNANAEMAVLETQTVISNDRFELKWDDFGKFVLLKSKETGAVWSDIHYAAYQDGSTSARANSPISIVVEETTTLTWNTDFSFDVEDPARIDCRKTDTGLCVTYYFDLYEIAIPVSYSLREDALAISIDGANIQESGNKYRLVSVTVAPYLVSCANEPENYLFVPVGSGALIPAEETADGTRKFSWEVYGTDAARQVISNYFDEEPIRMPVFGAKNGETAVMGIIEEGAGAAVLEGQAGYERLEASNVGATFYFRGYDTFRHPYYATGNSVTTRVSDELADQKMTVAYYPLEGDRADYNAMAQVYREYLQKNGWLTEKKDTAPAYSITLLGGTTERKSVLGFAYDSLTSMTGYSQALDILKALQAQTGLSPMIRMQGYGDNGQKPGTIVGGGSYPGVFGSRAELKALEDFCKANGVPLLWDMDLVRYNQSGLGIAYGGDSAKTAILKHAERYLLTPLRDFDKDQPYRIIARDQLTNAMGQALKKAEKYGHTGVCFSTLGSMAYGDYGDSRYALKAQMENDVRQLLAQSAESGRLTGTAAANWYAACGADVLFDTPTGHGGYDVMGEPIPFYQMVFHSWRPMYTEPINLAESAQEQVMLAAAGGMGLGFSLTGTYADHSSELELVKLYAMLYTDNLSLIGQTLTESGFLQCYEATRDSAIVRYELLGNGLTATHFENGVILYANHTSGTVDSPAGELGSYGFAMQGK